MSTRREFILWSGRAIAGGLAASALLPVLESCAPSSIPSAPAVTGPPATPGPDGRIPVDIADLNASNPVKIVPGMTGSDGLPVMITFTAPATYRAISSYCPHQGCQVQPQVTNGNLPCLCHGSLFGFDGSLKQGPANKGLTVYDTVFDAANKQLRVKLA